MFAPVYFDHNATTPLAPAVLQAMLPWLESRFGNASSRHEYGRAARAAVDAARQQVAAAVGAHATEIVFTSGGSEANNLFVKGATACLRPGMLAVGAGEHPCVLRPAEQSAKLGWRLRRLALNSAGAIDAGDYAAALAEKPVLLSVMIANNETGVINDIAALAAAARRAGALFHSDAVQALGKLPLDFRSLNTAGVDALTLSAHKIHGPQGAGALVVAKRVELQPLIAGGGHERGLRSGTENVAAIVGFGAACEQAASRQAETALRLAGLRERLEAGLMAQGACIFGRETPSGRLANTSYFAFANLDGETLVGKLDRAGFAVASGAACSSANPEPSHVLAAMGVAPEIARGAVRVSLGDGNTTEQVDAFLCAVAETRRELKQMTALAL